MSMFQLDARDNAKYATSYSCHHRCAAHVKVLTALLHFQEPHINGPERVITDSGDMIVLGTTSGCRRPSVEEA